MCILFPRDSVTWDHDTAADHGPTDREHAVDGDEIGDGMSDEIGGEMSDEMASETSDDELAM